MAQVNVVHELGSTNTAASRGVASAKVNSISNDSRIEFNDLSSKLYSTRYYKNGSLKNKYGKGAPVRISLEDMASFKALEHNADEDFGNVELITVMVKDQSELSNAVNLSALNGFSNLKYISFKCFFDCSATDIEKAVVNPGNVRIFYSYVMPN